MGGACTTQRAQTTKNVIKLLLLGCPSVGKSTVFKQLTLLYNNGFDEGQRRAIREYILLDIFDSLLRIAEVVRQRDGDDFRVDTALQDQLRKILDAKDAADGSSASQMDLSAASSPKDKLDLSSPASDAYVKDLLTTVARILQDAKVTRAMAQLQEQKLQLRSFNLRDSAMGSNASAGEGPSQSVSEMDSSSTIGLPIEKQRSSLRSTAAQAAEIAAQTARHIQLPESWDHYLNRLRDMTSVDAYIPSDDDILRLRRVTEEAASITFQQQLNWPPGTNDQVIVPVQCVDVGGQVQHEYDWVQHGDNVTAVLYVMCPSDFDTYTEDGENKLRQSFTLLRKVASAEIFLTAQIIILFNKSDLLEEKLKYAKFSDFSRSYKGKNNSKDITAFLERKCRHIVDSARQDSNKDVNQVYTVKTCAIETTLMSAVLKRVLFGLFESTFRQIWPA